MSAAINAFFNSHFDKSPSSKLLFNPVGSFNLHIRSKEAFVSPLLALQFTSKLNFQFLGDTVVLPLGPRVQNYSVRKSRASSEFMFLICVLYV